MTNDHLVAIANQPNGAATLLGMATQGQINASRAVYAITQSKKRRPLPERLALFFMHKLAKVAGL